MDPEPDWHEVPLTHRGRFGGDVPENSLPAFEAAMALGHGVELDVRVTADGVAVVAHDDDLLRLTGTPGRVSRMQAIDVCARPLLAPGSASDPAGATIPRLVEALDLLAGRVPCMVEVKQERSVGRSEQAVAAAMDAAPAADRCVASFNPFTLAWFRRHRPGLERALTVHRLGPLGGGEWFRWVLGRTVLGHRVDPHGVSVDLEGVGGTAIARWRESGGALWTWTVKTEDDLARARAADATPIHELAELG